MNRAGWTGACLSRSCGAAPSSMPPARPPTRRRTSHAASAPGCPAARHAERTYRARRSRMIRASMTAALTLILAWAPLTAAPVAAQGAAPAQVVLPTDRTVLPIPEPQYPHSTVFDVRNARPPPRFEVKAPAKAPNVLIVLIDDMGFGQSR